MWMGLLGPLHIQHGAVTISVPAAKQRIVLGALLTQANRVVSFDELAEAVWDGAVPAASRVTLRSYVMRLRQVVGPEVGARIRTRDPGYCIDVGDDELDLTCFSALCESGGAAVRAGSWEPAEADLAEALNLWRGQPLADVPSGALRREELPRLESLRLQALEWRHEAQLHLGLHEQLVPHLLNLVAQHPLRERFRAQLMLAYYRCGRQADALSAYQDARRDLVGELGVEPGPELSGLQERILSADPDLWGPAGYHRADQAGELSAAVPSERDADRLAWVGSPPRQLPPKPRYFAGRVGELAALDRLLELATGAGGTIVISAIGGAAGVGKSTLALQWAHRAAERFPDGQLYVNLRGFDPSGTPMAAADAIRGFLDAFHVPASAIPASLQAQAGLYRSLLADRRVLIVLDNARHAEQVRPLLAGGQGCLVLVTSRSQLTGLVAADCAHPVPLGLLTEPEARELLARRLGATRLARESAAAANLIELCVRLPLALSITAARAAANPGITLAAFARELAEARLDALTTGEEATDARAVFSWSYQHLAEPAAGLFRLLGTHPGPHISAAGAASLTGRSLPDTREALAELTRAHLVQEIPGKRYAFHDLLRAYASEKAYSQDTPGDRRLAAHRMLDHYLHSAHAADRALYPARDPITPAAPQAGTNPEKFTDEEQALSWFNAEHQVLLGVVAGAEADGFDRHVWQLAHALETYFYRFGHLHEWVAIQRAALAAAERAGDIAARAYAHRAIASACIQLRSFDDTFHHNSEALSLYQELGDRIGQARVYLENARAYDRQDMPRESLSRSQQSIELFRAEGHQFGLAAALNQAGWAHAMLGEHRRAVELCQQALDLAQAAHNRPFIATISDSLGYAHYHLGNHSQADALYRRALLILEQIGAPAQRADTLTYMGDALHAAGRPQAARQAWHEAVAILDRLHSDADQVRVRLRDLDGMNPRCFQR
jgi:DNA-binding SARP family transcriptional activator/tetratricopeptide (TPR) repeat protein